MKEEYTPSPFDELHALILEEFHTFRNIRSNTEHVMMTGSELSAIIGNAKTKLYKEQLREKEKNGG